MAWKKEKREQAPALQAQVKYSTNKGYVKPFFAVFLGGRRAVPRSVGARVAISFHSPNNDPVVPAPMPFALRVSDFDFRVCNSEVPPCPKPSSSLQSALPSAALIKVRSAPRAPTISPLSPSRKRSRASPASPPRKLTT